MKILAVFLSVVSVPVFATDAIDQSEYQARKKQAYEWYESLPKNEQRKVKKNVELYGELMKNFNSLMVKMNESERIYVIEEYNKENDIGE